ncbi:MAG: P-loop NTPase [Planctomycetota bacterium]
MKWTEARKRLLNLATGRESAPSAEPPPPPAAEPGGDGAAERLRSTPPPAGRPGPRLAEPEERCARAVSLCVASGKGGTGKSVLTASLAQLLAARARTILLDADLGVGNAHILQDVSPERTLLDVAEGRHAVRDVRTPCGASIDLIAAGSGVPRMADLSTYEMHLIAHGLDELEGDYGFVLVDSAAGISRQTMAFAEASDVTLVVTTPDLTAMTDAYAFLKVLFTRRAAARTLLVVNRAESEGEAERVQHRITDVCGRFLGQAPRVLGWIPSDSAVVRAVNHRSSVVAFEPESRSARAVERLACRLVVELAGGADSPAADPRGLGRQLLRKLGYSGEGA